MEEEKKILVSWHTYHAVSKFLLGVPLSLSLPLPLPQLGIFPIFCKFLICKDLSCTAPLDCLILD